MKIDKVYVCGDIHGDIDIHKLNIDNWPEQKDLSQNDLLVILGDFGLFWNNEQDKEEKHWLNWLLDKKCQIAFIDGNHENHPLINSFTIVEMFGGNVHKCFTNKNGKTLYHLMRGEIYNFAENKVLICGGATSIDKQHRKEFISWWEEELPSFSEYKNLEDNLKKHKYKIDYILTHTAPSSVVDKMFNIYTKCYLSSIFNELVNTIEFREWHFGHFHEDKKHGKFQCHFENEPKRII